VCSLGCALGACCQQPVEASKVPITALNIFKENFPQPDSTIRWFNYQNGNFEGVYNNAAEKVIYSIIFDKLGNEIEKVENYTSDERATGGFDMPAKLGISIATWRKIISTLVRHKVEFGGWVDKVNKKGQILLRPYSNNGLPFAEFDIKGNYIRKVGYQ
jgi:hypothetical protein